MIIFIEVLNRVTFVNIMETFPCKVIVKILIRQFLDFGRSNTSHGIILYLEIFAKFSFTRIAFKDTLAAFKIRD